MNVAQDQKDEITFHASSVPQDVGKCPSYFLFVFKSIFCRKRLLIQSTRSVILHMWNREWNKVTRIFQQAYDQLPNWGKIFTLGKISCIENFTLSGTNSIKIQPRNEDKPKNEHSILHVLFTPPSHLLEKLQNNSTSKSNRKLRFST